MTFINLTPAYGRHYNNRDELVESLREGEDFIFHDPTSPYDGKPCSPLSDFGAASFRVRYGVDLEKVTVVEFEEALPSEVMRLGWQVSQLLDGRDLQVCLQALDRAMLHIVLMGMNCDVDELPAEVKDSIDGKIEQAVEEIREAVLLARR